MSVYLVQAFFSTFSHHQKDPERYVIVDSEGVFWILCSGDSTWILGTAFSKMFLNKTKPKKQYSKSVSEN